MAWKNTHVQNVNAIAMKILILKHFSITDSFYSQSKVYINTPDKDTLSDIVYLSNVIFFVRTCNIGMHCKCVLNVYLRKEVVLANLAY
jgi:hypothetical protein